MTTETEKVVKAIDIKTTPEAEWLRAAEIAAAMRAIALDSIPW